MLGRMSGSTAASAESRLAIAAVLGLLVTILMLAVGGRAVAGPASVGGGPPAVVDEDLLNDCDLPPESTKGCLTVHVGGPPPAEVSVTPIPEPGSDPHPCQQQDVPDSNGCRYILPQGPVRVIASPADLDNPRRFLGWSDPVCGSNPECDTTVGQDSSTIVATFKPIRLFLSIAGYGTLTATPPGHPLGTCGPPEPPVPPDETPSERCPIEYSTITEVEIEATPTNAEDTVRWSQDAFCDPDPDRATRCRAHVNFDPTEAGVGFGVYGPPGNFGVSVWLNVLRGGDGSGRVTGVETASPGEQIINCGLDCSASVQYQRRVSLTAHPDVDSTFERWAGICSTDPECRFSAGAVTRVRAIFGKKAAPPHPPQPPPQPTPPRPQPPGSVFSARILRVSVVRTRAGRVVVARIRVNAAAAGRAQVKRGRRALVGRAVRVRVGVNTLRLPLRATVRRGPAWFAITLRNATTTPKSFRKRFTVPRRR